MKYDNYLRTVARAFDASFDYIDATFGFDYGPEFEIAFCRALRSILPSRMGICRGFVVPEDGNSAGDDIIVFDRHSFPVLRMLEQDAFDRKQKVPVDAVYAYIEAKHTLVIEGEGKSSLARAEDQVRKVQALDGVVGDSTQMACYRLGINETCFDRNSPPPGRSPIFGAVISRFVKIKDSDRTPASAQEIKAALAEGYGAVTEEYSIEDAFGLPPDDEKKVLPPSNTDLVVAGKSNILLPFDGVDRPLIVSPYLAPATSRLHHAICENMAFAMGVCSLLWALEMSHLGRMPWPILLADAFVATDPNAPTGDGNASK